MFGLLEKITKFISFSNTEDDKEECIKEHAPETYINEILQEFFEFEDDELEDFNNMIFENDILIAGGIVLKAIKNFKVLQKQDIDMFMTFNSFKLFNYYISEFCSNIKLIRIVNPNDSEYISFVKMNKIMYIYTYQCLNINNQFDVIICFEDPKTVIQNFDLSCCQVMFNGKEIIQNYKELNDQNLIAINPNYTTTKFNPQQKLILYKRIKKYESRGFKIIYSFDKFLIPYDMQTYKNELSKYETLKKNMAIKHINNFMNNIYKYGFLTTLDMEKNGRKTPDFLKNFDIIEVEKYNTFNGSITLLPCWDQSIITNIDILMKKLIEIQSKSVNDRMKRNMNEYM